MEEANRENASIPSPYFHVEVAGFSKPRETTVKEGLSPGRSYFGITYKLSLSQRACAYWLAKNITTTVKFSLSSFHLEKKFYLPLGHSIILDVPAGSAACGKIEDLGFWQTIQSLNPSSISDQCLLVLVSSFVKKKKKRQKNSYLPISWCEINGNIYPRCLAQKR